MTKRTNEEWKALVAAHAASGQTATAFCRTRGINAKYFSTRRRALTEVPTQTQSKFSPVLLTSPQHNADIRVEPAWLADLLRKLRE